MKINVLFQFAVFILLNLFLSFTVVGQDSTYTFKVLLDNGKSYVRNTDIWQNMTPGTALNSEDYIRLDEDAYLGLIHTGGHTLTLTKPGIYRVQELAAQFLNPSAGVAMHYADLLIAEMQSNKIKSNGAFNVERSSGNGNPERSDKLKLLLPNTVNVYNKKVLIMWNSIEGVDTYEVMLKDMFDEVITTQTLQGTKFTLDFTNPMLSDEKLVIVSVKTKGIKELQSNNYGIKPLGQDETSAIEQGLSQLKQEISEKESALDKIILASFYEQNNLLVDALTNYEYAISLSPNTEVIKAAYDQFLTRNGLKAQIATK